MKEVFIFSLVEVQPKPGSALKKANPKAIGAFVNAIIEAETLSSAKHRLQQFLSQDGFKLISFGEFRTFKDYTENMTDIPDEVLIAVREVVEYNSVWYRDFSTYEA
jgi:hypothetical protein